MFKLKQFCYFPVIFLLFLLIFPGISLAEETITITTYYPSPYGVYREMRAKRIAIGDTYFDGAEVPWEEINGDGGLIDYLADLVVEGNVGIGTTNMPDDRATFHLGGTKRISLQGRSDFADSRFWRLGHDDVSAWGNFDISVGDNNSVAPTAANQVVMTLTKERNVGIGTTSAPLKLTVLGRSGPYGAALFKNDGYANVFSILPYSGGVTYLSSGIYYNGTWIQANDNAYNQLFVLDTANGARWYASSTGTASWNLAPGIILWNNSGTWVGSSSRKLKENFTQLNPDDLLNKINQLDITRWNFKSEGKKITHIGPVAEDFYHLFKTGDAEDHLATIDTAGVSLAGVKALSGKVKSQQEQIKSQQEQIKSQQKQIEVLKLHNRQLEERLNSVEEKIKKPLK
ncbi:MAG: tail fiber domain-containing protein [Candidatus Omnitrophica bacterium]|nr:tail fiber domain-containing protein [Candidatus Omnitrophota bacterium]